LGLPKRGNIWGRKKLLDTQFGKSKGGYREFVVKNLRFYFDIPQILFVVLIFISTKHGILV
jgi:hypothetical protein